MLDWMLHRLLLHLYTDAGNFERFKKVIYTFLKKLFLFGSAPTEGSLSSVYL